MVNGSIYKTENNTYRLRYKKDKKTYSKTVKCKNINEAKILLNRLISDINNNLYQDNINYTFYDLTKVWLEHHAIPNLSPTTLDSYKRMLNKEILPVLGDMKASSINKIHIQEIINSLREQERTTKTQKKYLLLISAIFNFAIEMDYLKFNPAASMKIRANSMEKKTEMQIYDHEEINLLFEALDKEENKELVDMILIDLYTGLRRGELMGLMPKDYDPGERTLTISRNRVKEGGTPVIKDTKNHKSRTFLLNNACCDIFDRICKNKSKNELLFQMHPDTFTKEFKRFLKKNNLKDIRVYDLRHTNASMLHSEGIDYATIAARIGNLPSTTANFYIHKVNEKDVEAKEKLDIIFKRS